MAAILSRGRSFLDQGGLEIIFFDMKFGNISNDNYSVGFQMPNVIVRRAGLLWSQQDFEWLWSVPLSSASLY